MIPEDILFTSEFTEEAEMEDSNSGAGLVSEILIVVDSEGSDVIVKPLSMHL